MTYKIRLDTTYFGIFFPLGPWHWNLYCSLMRLTNHIYLKTIKRKCTLWQHYLGYSWSSIYNYEREICMGNSRITNAVYSLIMASNCSGVKISSEANALPQVSLQPQKISQSYTILQTFICSIKKWACSQEITEYFCRIKI